MVFFLLPGEIFYLKGSKKFTRDNQKDNFLGKYINIHELINITIDCGLAIKDGSSLGELYMTPFVLKLYGIVVHKFECLTKNWPALTKKMRNSRWPL